MVSYDRMTGKVILNSIEDLDAGIIYVAIVGGGTNGAKDTAGNALEADKIWSFGTAPPS